MDKLGAPLPLVYPCYPSLPLTADREFRSSVNSLSDISGNTPNFSTFTPGRNFVLYSIRGLSNFNFLSRDPVAFYVDEVPYDYTGFLDLDLNDLERVEVLRGPQSTLYGRNATFGVVNIITRKPANDFEFNGTASYGNYNNLDLRAGVSGPLIEDELFFRLSGSYETRDGYLRNTFLILLDYFGWRLSLSLLALCDLLLLVPVLFFTENPASYKSERKLDLKVSIDFFRRQKIGRWVGILLLYMMGVTIANTMFRPLLVDLGLSLAQIGVMKGIFAYSAGLVGSFVSGFSIEPLGRKRALIGFGLLMATANAAFILPTLGFTDSRVLYAIAIWFEFAYSMACIPMYAVMMDNSRLGSAGFDYTLQVSIVFVGSLIAGALSGFIATTIGYRGTFALSAAISLIGVAVIAKTFEDFANSV